MEGASSEPSGLELRIGQHIGEGRKFELISFYPPSGGGIGALVHDHIDSEYRFMKLYGVASARDRSRVCVIRPRPGEEDLMSRSIEVEGLDRARKLTKGMTVPIVYSRHWHEHDGIRVPYLVTELAGPVSSRTDPFISLARGQRRSLVRDIRSLDRLPDSIDPYEIIGLLAQACEQTREMMYSANIVKRDIKPSNILRIEYSPDEAPLSGLDLLATELGKLVRAGRSRGARTNSLEAGTMHVDFGLWHPARMRPESGFPREKTHKYWEYLNKVYLSPSTLPMMSLQEHHRYLRLWAGPDLPADRFPHTSSLSRAGRQKLIEDALSRSRREIESELVQNVALTGFQILYGTTPLQGAIERIRAEAIRADVARLGFYDQTEPAHGSQAVTARRSAHFFEEFYALRQRFAEDSHFLDVHTQLPHELEETLHELLVQPSPVGLREASRRLWFFADPANFARRRALRLAGASAAGALVTYSGLQHFTRPDHYRDVLLSSSAESDSLSADALGDFQQRIMETRFLPSLRDISDEMLANDKLLCLESVINRRYAHGKYEYPAVNETLQALQMGAALGVDGMNSQFEETLLLLPIDLEDELVHYGHRVIRFLDPAYRALTESPQLTSSVEEHVQRSLFSCVRFFSDHFFEELPSGDGFFLANLADSSVDGTHYKLRTSSANIVNNLYSASQLLSSRGFTDPVLARARQQCDQHADLSMRLLVHELPDGLYVSEGMDFSTAPEGSPEGLHYESDSAVDGKVLRTFTPRLASIFTLMNESSYARHGVAFNALLDQYQSAMLQNGMRPPDFMPLGDEEPSDMGVNYYSLARIASHWESSGLWASSYEPYADSNLRVLLKQVHTSYVPDVLPFIREDGLLPDCRQSLVPSTTHFVSDFYFLDALQKRIEKKEL